MSNVREIAQRLGMSVATVSRVLNHRTNVAEETRRRVLTCFDELQYIPDDDKCRAIRHGKYNGLQKKIVLVLCGNLPEDPVCAVYLSNLVNACACSNNQLAIVYLKEGTSELFELPSLLRKKQCDGVILYGYLTSRLTTLFRELDLPGVVIGTYPQNVIGSFSNITPNFEHSTGEIVQRLQQRGVRNVACVVECPDNYANSRYLKLFEAAVGKLGMRLEATNIYTTSQWMGGVLDLLKPVFRRRELPFDGVFCVDERIAREVDKLNFMHAELFGVPQLPVATIRNSHHSGYEKILITPDNRKQDHELAVQCVALLLETIQAARENKPFEPRMILVQ